MTDQGKVDHINRRQFLKKARMAAGGAFLALGGTTIYAVMIERHLIQINHYQISLPNLPTAFSGFRIAHLTDLHYGPFVTTQFIQRVVALTNQIRADAIVCTGDYVHDINTTASIDTIWPLLSTLSAPWVVYSVLGNHDHWADFNRSRYWLEKSEQNLYKIAKPFEKDGQQLWLGGAGDRWEDTDGIDQAFRTAPDNACKICLAHNPDTVDLKYQTQIDLFLCGHTHGGQIWWPVLNRPITDQQLPVENKNYISGLIQTNDRQIFISRGVGCAVLPVRFNCPPEIALLELIKDESPHHLRPI